METENEISPQQCSMWKECNDMICPMDQGKEKRIWYAEKGFEEDVCNNPEYRNNFAVRNQKKLKRFNPSGYFTYQMLNRDIIIRKGITGIDPDVPETVYDRGQKTIDKLYEDREQSWIAEHSGFTAEQKQQARERGMKNIEALKPYHFKKKAVDPDRK